MTSNTRIQSPDHALSRAVVFDAIKNKYSIGDDDDFALAFEQCWQQAATTSYPEVLSALVRPPIGAETDILNQVVVLFMIERLWKWQLPESPLLAIHQLLIGDADPLASTRRSHRVPDYHGTGLMDFAEAPSRRDEFERMYRALIPKASNASLDMQARLLALVLSSVVRIHPFADANGRTARFAVQLALRVWGMPLVPLPKVRNDPEWAMALSIAVEMGDLSPLSAALRSRLEATSAMEG